MGAVAVRRDVTRQLHLTAALSAGKALERRDVGLVYVKAERPEKAADGSSNRGSDRRGSPVDDLFRWKGFDGPDVAREEGAGAAADAWPRLTVLAARFPSENACASARCEPTTSASSSTPAASTRR